MRWSVHRWLKSLYVELNDGKAAQVVRPWQTKSALRTTTKRLFKLAGEAGFDDAWNLVSFFKSHRCLFWGMKAGRDIEFIRSTVDLDLPNSIIVLDGSAAYSPIRWKGFTILRVKEHRQCVYPNVEVRAVPYNPTKKQLAKHIDLLKTDVSGFLNQNPAAKIFVASNRNLSKLVNVQKVVDDLKSIPTLCI